MHKIKKQPRIDLVKGSRLVKTPPRKKVVINKTVPCFNNDWSRKENASPINTMKLSTAPNNV